MCIRDSVAQIDEGVAEWLELGPCEIHAYCKHPRGFRHELPLEADARRWRGKTKDHARSRAFCCANSSSVRTPFSRSSPMRARASVTWSALGAASEITRLACAITVSASCLASFAARGPMPVSYTHLTLPTILR